MTTPDNKTRRLHREENSDQRHAKYIICKFYTGILPSGEISPGWVDSSKFDRRPAAYIVPLSEEVNSDYQRTVDPIQPGLGMDSTIKWVKENVRLIKIANPPGISSAEIMDKYLVRVPYPMSSASTGELVKRPGLMTSQRAVPDGKSKTDMALDSLANRKIPLEKRMPAALSRYKTSNGKLAAPTEFGTEEFPAPGDNWTKG